MLHIYGAEIVPGSSYSVDSVLETCSDALGDAGSFSPPLLLSTGKWGDVGPLFAGDDPGAPQPDFNDIAGVVKKFTADPAAPIKAHAQLQPNVVLPDRPIDFKDIAAAVAAFVEVSYAVSFGATGPCACPSAVTCGDTACENDLTCAPGYCIGGFCTDACGRCTP